LTALAQRALSAGISIQRRLEVNDVGPKIFALVMFVALGTGCTGIGMHTSKRDTVDYGPPQELRLCLLKTDKVPDARAAELVTAVNEEFAPFGITVTVPWVRAWERPGFTVNGIFPALLERELEEPCDRLMGLIDYHAGDFVWSLFLPQVLGAVETETHTHGYVFATFGSINQIGTGPKSAMVHEFYHLIGCPHAATKTKCYEQIAALKASRPPRSELFPGMDDEGKFLHTRAEVNEVLREVLAEMEKNAQERKSGSKQTVSTSQAIK
jgi:hypothetical protein